MNGWCGKLLRINLTEKTGKVENLDENILRNFIGGRGLGAKLLYDEVKPETEPLSAENKLIFTVGPLTATGAPTAGRYSITSKSPLTGTIFDSNSGGHFGLEIKKAGYDAVVIEGTAEKLTYLFVNDENVRFEDASELAGLDTHTTTDKVLAGTDERARVACIGPAGEKLGLIGCIINDRHRAAGRGGLGAVMGSKNLKAIAVLGTGSPAIAQPERFEAAKKLAQEAIAKNPVTKDALPNYGTAVLVNVINEIGALPTKNYQEGIFKDADAISGETIRERIFVRRSACGHCPIACGRVTRAGGEEGEGPEYETVWAFGADCGVNDIEKIAIANYKCNRYGLDTISTGATIACAMELSERGVITEYIRFGNADAVLQLIDKIGSMEGIGEKLAMGSYRFAKEYGAEEYSMSVKGLELPAYDPRGVQGMGLAYATSNRGGCHLRGYMTAPEVLGNPYMVDRLKTEGKAGLTVLLQNISAAVDSLVLCRFSQFGLNPEHYAEMLSAATGIDYSDTDLLLAGERIYNLERVYNVRARVPGDTLPKRLLTEKLKEGHSKGYVVELDTMLRQYYEIRGWDENGVPLKETLKRLGL
ncbi:MAG: aldehyde ferredoxin oxidoreductase family protein [Thermoplasmata archaeon]|nr:aldehyde ferredoxin oxidoreductase family protein [Thermoplasmata archaeon]